MRHAVRSAVQLMLFIALALLVLVPLLWLVTVSYTHLTLPTIYSV